MTTSLKTKINYRNCVYNIMLKRSRNHNYINQINRMIILYEHILKTRHRDKIIFIYCLRAGSNAKHNLQSCFQYTMHD